MDQDQGERERLDDWTGRAHQLKLTSELRVGQSKGYGRGLHWIGMTIAGSVGLPETSPSCRSDTPEPLLAIPARPPLPTPPEIHHCIPATGPAFPRLATSLQPTHQVGTLKCCKAVVCRSRYLADK